MYRILPLLGDIGLGILVIVFVSVFMEQYSFFVWLLLPVALLPDLDGLGEIVKKGRVAASKDNPHDHRELLHKPILWLMGAMILWVAFGYPGAVVFFMLLLHFLHDSVLTGWGVPWLWPFTKKRYKFFVDKKNELSLLPKDWFRSWDERELHVAIVAYGYEDWIERLYLRPTAVSVIEYSIFSSSIVALVWYLLA